MKITAQTRIAGVVGNPVRHSLSPVIHNAWIEAGGLDAVYLAFEPAKDGFRRFVEGLRGGVVLGLNVTIPFKEEALALADEANERASKAGAANLLLFGADGGIKADNTDGFGMMLALSKEGFQCEGPGFVVVSAVRGATTTGRAVILGAGGAARGAAAALVGAGVSHIAIVNRTVDRARTVSGLDQSISAHGWDEAAGLLEGAGLLINATSLGMTGQPPLEIKLDPLPTDAIVMDMVYRPLWTPLLRQAKARGNRTVSGLTMLIDQAVPAFNEIFGGGAGSADVWSLCLDALGEEP